MRNARPSRWLLLSAVAILPWVTTVIPLRAAPVPAAKVAGKPAARAMAAKPRDAKKRLVTYAGQDDAPLNQGEPASRATRHAVDPLAVAAQVDALILDELAKTSADVAPRCSDEDFLRRVSFDIAGVSPSPQDVTLFGLDPDSDKRAAAIDRLLTSSQYAENWARYWRDVVFSRATEMRALLARPTFEKWLKAEFAANKSWDQLTTAMLTAVGDVSEAGQTGLIFAQQGDPKEVAAETSRIFLGIQLQCANCHDHPTDNWKRDQFHSLAAFFPRTQSLPKPDSMNRSYEIVSLNVDAGGRGAGRGNFMQLQQNPEGLIRRLDTNGDGKISREEAKNGPNGGQFLQRLFDQGDANKDGYLTAEEIKKMPPPQVPRGRGSPEYYLPDLQRPEAQGKKIDPVFFLGNLKAGSGLSDLDRRKSLARFVTSPDNPWFAKAFVNRLWGQLVGEGFYMPIDDMGPERSPRYPAALDVLGAGFTASGYDIAWLFRAITNSETYQRQIRPRDPKAPAPAFASAAPIRLRADQLYDAIARVLGFKEDDAPQGPPMMMGGPYQGLRTLRGQFFAKFGFDPSTTPDDLTGTIQQALFMMNNQPMINNLIRATNPARPGSQTRLHQILEKYKSDDDALSELYLIVHAREPSPREAQVCRDYLRQVNNRSEAFEDILWSLLNSTEFQTKR